MEESEDLAERIARQALAGRGARYAGEVRALLDAALEVMRRRGTASRPRVADIVAASGLSNEAFYRHFRSKDALVAAILEDGAARLCGYLAHRMAKEPAPEDKVHRWVEGVLSQAMDEETAATTLAVMWNAQSVGEGFLSGPPSTAGLLAELLREPYGELGSENPELDASLAAHATMGRLADHLWRRTPPTGADVDHITRFCLRTVAPRGAYE
ncbi:helix-turn-helix domain-containing protein [Streptomyces sp. SID13726]|uniref:TetR/AcrR family transcriptional regulator n=1 Tax=Streptomyces sp. SID13726 TaxID=2706058 RepID=UPI0013B6D385|nr:helix-turn-helix domain-containing protein [Streptomyces sp. SID13726]NEB02795.1 helix-turn-helix transcriptional regulator [Streptomyces sp. SID13726]